MEVTKDERSWRIGTASDVAWIADRPAGVSVATAIPLVFQAYATFHRPDRATEDEHEHAVVEVLRQHTAEQPWWLGYLDTGAHDVVFPEAPLISLYWDWTYVLVQAGPTEALTWRTGHMRGGMHGALPDLFFPQDRSWLVSGCGTTTGAASGAQTPSSTRSRASRWPTRVVWGLTKTCSRPGSPASDGSPPADIDVSTDLARSPKLSVVRTSVRAWQSWRQAAQRTGR